jgi:hypothetical protein
VSQTEDDARLVGLFDGTEQGCLLRIADHEESGVVVLSEVTPVLIGLNSFFFEFPLAARAYTGKNSDTRIIVII